MVFLMLVACDRGGAETGETGVEGPRLIWIEEVLVCEPNAVVEWRPPAEPVAVFSAWLRTRARTDGELLTQVPQTASMESSLNQSGIASYYCGDFDDYTEELAVTWATWEE